MVPRLFIQGMIPVGFVVLAAALGLFLTPVGAAPPQQNIYPPVGPCVLVVSAAEVAPSTGECLPITCQVMDAEGAPSIDVECTPSISSQPGTDAALTPTSAMTDEKGEATAELCVGSTPGPIVVLAEAEGCQGQVQVTVQASTAVLPVQATVTAPAAPPATGAGMGGGDSSSAPLIAIWGAIALAVGGVMVWRIGSGRRQRS